MQCGQEFSFTELKCKLVINVLDGKILGNIIDIIFFPQTGKILGFVVPGEKRGWFKSCETIFIPYSCVCKVGIDCILVKLCIETKIPQKNNNKFCNMIGILDDKQKIENEVLGQNESFDLEQQYKNFSSEEKNIEVVDDGLYSK